MTAFIWRDFDALSARELHDMLKLRADVFVVEQACIFADIDGKDPLAFHLLARAEADGALAGTLRLFSPALGAGRARIGRIATTASARGTGLGTAMMTEAFAEAERRFGAVTIRIEAQSRLETFYGRLGFVRAGEDYVEDGILHCVMLKG